MADVVEGWTCSSSCRDRAGRLQREIYSTVETEMVAFGVVRATELWRKKLHERIGAVLLLAELAEDGVEA